MPTFTPGTARQVYTRLVRHITQLAADNNGQGASLVGIEDAAGYFTGITVEEALAELYLAATTAGSDTFTDTGNYYATDTVGAALVALGVAIGGATSTTRNYSSNTAIADNDDLVVAAGKLDARVGAYQDQLVTATIAVADVGGGGTNALLMVDLKRAYDNATDPATICQVLIKTSAAQYTPDQALNGNCTFGTVTAGAIVASGNGWALVSTDATGNFACTVTNAVDETVWFYVVTPEKVSDLGLRSVVVASTVDSATWAA